MHRPDEEDEEDLRTYASVFQRLTSGAPPPTPPRHQKLLAEGRQRASVIGGRLREDAAKLSAHLREDGVALTRRLRDGIGARARGRGRASRAAPGRAGGSRVSVS